MKKEQIAKKLLKLAKILNAGLGWNVTLTGGNVGGTAWFLRDVSFNFYNAAHLSRMLDRARGEVSGIMSKSKVWKFDISDVGMDSQGTTKGTVLIKAEVKLRFKNEEEIDALVDYLEFSPKVDKVENWIS
jgi:hypothetical protein